MFVQFFLNSLLIYSLATVRLRRNYVLHLQAWDNESSTEEEVEPKLKYSRISNDLKSILSKDAVSCIAVNSKVC